MAYLTDLRLVSTKYVFARMVVFLQIEQLKELKQEFMKQEQQLIEVKKNSTTLEKKLEYERFVVLHFSLDSLHILNYVFVLIHSCTGGFPIYYLFRQCCQWLKYKAV